MNSTKNSWNHGWQPMNMVLISNSSSILYPYHIREHPLLPGTARTSSFHLSPLLLLKSGHFQEIIRLKSRNSRKSWATGSTYLLYVIHRDTCSIDRWLARIVSKRFHDIPNLFAVKRYSFQLIMFRMEWIHLQGSNAADFFTGGNQRGGGGWLFGCSLAEWSIADSRLHRQEHEGLNASEKFKVEYSLRTFLWHCQIQPFSENYERLANNLWVKKLSKGKPDAGKYKGKRLRSNPAVEDGSLSNQLSFFVDILRFCHLFRQNSISHVSQCCHLSIIISHKAARVWWKCFHLLPLWSLPRSSQQVVKSSIASSSSSSFVWRIAYGSNQEWIIKDLNVSSFHDLTLGFLFRACSPHFPWYIITISIQFKVCILKDIFPASNFPSAQVIAKCDSW